MKRRPDQSPPTPARGATGLLTVGLWLGAALVVVATRLSHAWTLSFINDDFLFLDKAGRASFLSLWAPTDLVTGYYRPWSRELHDWTLLHLFGPNPAAFRAANVALWLAALGLYFLLARRIAGLPAAAIATAGAAAGAAWGVLLVWPAGSQDLWMLVFALACLHAHLRGRRLLALAALALALLSKELAAVLPAIAAALDAFVERRSVREALRRAAPAAVLVLAWAAFHPLLGGRLWYHGQRPFAAEFQSSPLTVAGALLGGLANLDAWPAPEAGWKSALTAGLPAAVALAALVAWAIDRARRARQPARSIARSRSAALRLGVVWALVGWAPLLVPSLGIHSYYGSLGNLGAWLALGAALQSTGLLAAGLVALIAAVAPARAGTPSFDWGSEWFLRRAAILTGAMRNDLVRRHPKFPPHSRLFFGAVQAGTGLVASPGNSPALRLWYGDRTLRGSFLSQYVSRSAGDTRGGDFFFVSDSAGRWTELIAGAEDVARARRENPAWAGQHESLASQFFTAGDHALALAEYRKLAEAEPDQWEYAYDVGVCAAATGDSAAALSWYERAAGNPGAGEQVKRALVEFRRLLGPRASAPAVR